MKLKATFSLLIIMMISALTIGQVKTDSELFLILKKNDSLLFDVGFNKCDLSSFEHLISQDLEFYHDQGGLTTNKEDFLKNVRNNICSSPDKKPIRKLKEESLEVFPLYNNGQLYGAIQKGEHSFFIKEPGKEIYPTSTAKFTHVWLLKDGRWVLKRVLSYDHKG